MCLDQPVIVVHLLHPQPERLLRGFVQQLFIREQLGPRRRHKDRAADHRHAAQNFIRQANHRPPVAPQKDRVALAAAVIPCAAGKIAPIVEVVPGNILVRINNQ
jgi:hypothetical protein